MDPVSAVWARKAKGEKVALCRDVYGNHWAELRKGWLLPKRTRLELTVEQYRRLSSIMSSKRRRDVQRRSAQQA